MDIKKRAERLIKNCGTDNPFTAADFLGIKIMELDLSGPFGHYLKYSNRKRIIIAPYTPAKLRNFVCAHELGHALVTEDDNTTLLTAFTGRAALSNIVERRANEFAVRFLLNDAYLKENTDISVYTLADLRGVPKKYLGLMGI